MNETACIFDIQRFSLKNGPGIRTTVFFKGCPLRCPWCSNPESQAFAPELLFEERLCARCGECTRACPAGKAPREMPGCAACAFVCAAACKRGALKQMGQKRTPSEILEIALRDREYYERSGGGLTLSGGECLAQPEVALRLLRAAKESGLHTAVDTSLYAPREIVEASAKWTDLYLADLKHMDGEKHRRLTGKDNELILQNLKLLFKKKTAIRIRFPVIGGVNDDDENIRRMAAFVKGAPNVTGIDLLPAHALSTKKYAGLNRQWTPPAAPSPERLRSIARGLAASGKEAVLLRA